MEVLTRQRGGEDRCPACIRQRHGGGLGPEPPHTCLTHQTIGQLATRQRAKRLARMNRQRSAQADHPAGSNLRERSIGVRFEVR
jgi:hypothetical protein